MKEACLLDFSSANFRIKNDLLILGIGKNKLKNIMDRKHKMLKKIIILSCCFFQVFGSGGQPAQADSKQPVKSTQETLITQTKKLATKTNPFLDTVSTAQEIQDIILGYINQCFHNRDILDSQTFVQPKTGAEKLSQSSDFAYSPDGKYIALVRSGIQLNQLAIYDSNLQNPKIYEWYEDLKNVRLRYSRDGKYVALFCAYKIIIFDASTLKILKIIDRAGIENVIFMQNSTHLMGALIIGAHKSHPENGLYDCHWNIEEPKFTRVEFGTENPSMIRVVDLSPDGNHVIETVTSFALSSGFVVWDYQTRKKIASHKICFYYVRTVAYSPSGLYFAVVGTRKINIYDTQRYTLLSKIDCQFPSESVMDFPCHCIAFSPDDKCLAFATKNSIHIVDLKTKKRIFTHTFENCLHPKLAYDPSGAVISVCLDDRISLFDAPSSVCFADDGDRWKLMREKLPDPVPKCGHCQKSNAALSKKLKRCGRCHKNWYCSVECQSVDWNRHKWACIMNSTSK